MGDYIVYCHENLINGKKYFGITSQKPHGRWRDGRGYCNNEHFSRAIQKYGWHGFRHTVIHTGLSKSQAELLEVKLIAKYDTTNSKKGYNIEKGGNGAGRVTEETRKKISEALKGHPCSTETRQKIANAKKGKPSPMKGKIMSAENIEKNRLAHKGQTPWNKGRAWNEIEKAKCNGKEVLCVETGVKYPTAHNAGRILGIDFSSICKCCRGRVKTAGGYHWEWVLEANNG